MRVVWGISVLLTLGCTNTVSLSRVRPSPDGGPALDAGTDAGPADAGPSDAGPVDGGVADAGPGDSGLTDGGQLPGDGGVSDAGWSGTWEPLGPPLGQEAQVYPAMAVDPSGALLVAFAELVESPGFSITEIHVVRWSGTAWEPVGGTIARSDMRFPYSAPLWLRLTTDRSGQPLLAFGDSGPGATSGVFPVQTWVFDGVAWHAVPVPGSAMVLGGVALARSANGQVQLAVSSGRALDVWTLGDTGWSAAVPALADDAGVSEPDLALGPDGLPLVAFSEAPAPGSFGPLRAWRWTGNAWVDLAVPWPDVPGGIVHTPRVRARSDGGVVVTGSAWQYDPLNKVQIGVAVPVLALGEGGWSLLAEDGAPGGFGLSEPIAGSPVGLQLANDVPVVVSTLADGGVLLRAIPDTGGELAAPVLGGLGAGTLLLGPDGRPIVGAVMPTHSGPSLVDGGQVQILHFTGAPVTGTPDAGGAAARAH